LLEQFIEDEKLKASIIELGVSVRTVKDVIKSVNCDLHEIVKSIVIVGKPRIESCEAEEYYLIILQGNRKVKTKKVKNVLSLKDAHLASPEQVKKVTGFNIGDVPPISVDLPVILDELVLEQKYVYAGGGNPLKLLKIEVEEIIECTHALVADISVPLD